MPREFRVAADLRPGRIRLSWLERVPGAARPSFRLVRRRRGFPAEVADGYTVVDLDDLFQPGAPAVPWGRIERHRCTSTNTGAEGGLLQGVLEQYYVGAAEPIRAVVGVFDAASGTLQRTELDDISRITTSDGPATPPFTRVQEWEIFAEPGGGPEVSRGLVTFFDYDPEETSPTELPVFRWEPASGPALEVEYLQCRREVTSSSDTGRRFETIVNGPAPSRRLTIRSEAIAEAGITEWTFTVDDGDLEPGVVYYYRLFGPGAPAAEPARGSALATGAYGAHDLMYRLLPPVYQVEDVDPTRTGGGRELYKFLAAFGLGVDHLRGQVDGIASRHDLAAVRADLLPHLARMIGWLPDLTGSRKHPATGHRVCAGVVRRRGHPSQSAGAHQSGHRVAQPGEGIRAQRPSYQRPRGRADLGNLADHP